MNRSFKFILLASLVLLPALWHLGWQEARQDAGIAAKVQTVSAVRNSLPEALPSPAVQPTTPPARLDARYPLRVANTDKSLSELMRDPAAILLQNALIDSQAPLELAIPKHLRAGGEPGAFIVQARGHADAAFQNSLRAAGVELVSYLPNNAWLVTADAGTAGRLAGIPQVLAVLPYEPYYKMADELLALAAAQKPVAENSLLNVVLFPGTREAAAGRLERLGAAVVREQPTPFGPQVTLRWPGGDVSELAQVPQVQAIERARARKPANDLARVFLSVAADSITPNNYLNLDGDGITVGINDSGVDDTHPDLSNRVFGVTVDSSGHGTHVAGSIAGNGTKSPFPVTNTPPGSAPGAIYRGMAPKAKLFSQNVFYDFYSDLDLQETTARTNVFVSNNSWNYPGDYSYSFASASFDAATRDALGGQPGDQPVLFVFAAGNDGDGTGDGTGGGSSTIGAPATAKNVITVGSLQQPRNLTNLVEINGETYQPWAALTDSALEVAAHSGRGNVGPGQEGDYGRFKPDVMAPGQFVISCRATNWQDPTSSSGGFVNNFGGVTLPAKTTNEFTIGVPADAIRLRIRIAPSILSPNPMPALPIFINRDTNTTAADLVGFNDVVAPITGGAATYYYAIGNPTDYPVTFDLVVTVGTTTDTGNYYDVLRSLNNDLVSADGRRYYRYESGTSMAAPLVSGVLALMQQYFEQTLQQTNSPALMKALLINGARSLPEYDLNTRSFINYQGWGAVNLTNSIPAVPAALFDQSTNRILMTGDSQAFTVGLSAAAQTQPLRVTLVWTDPPGNPVSSLKLVNDLDLVVSNNITHQVYVGNNFESDSDFVTPLVATNAAGSNVLASADTIADTVNNVENVFIREPNAASFTVYVSARRVNVNALTTFTNGIGQDYALVISSDARDAGALTATPPAAVVPNPAPLVKSMNNGQPLLKERVGANPALAATTNGVVNQWNFYVFTNATQGSNVVGTNLAFITFIPPNIGRLRSTTNADIDLYVSTDASLTNLNPVAIAGAFKSAKRGGNEAVIFTNATIGRTYYIGVKSEDRQGAEFGLFAYSSDSPFSQRDSEGNLIVNGMNVNISVPDGMPDAPDAGLVFAFAMEPITIRRVVVTNVLTHENLGDLIGILSHAGDGGEEFVVLNNHTFGDQLVPAAPVTYTFIYEDNQEGDVDDSVYTQGPGSLTDFIGEEGMGVWTLTMVDNALHHTGMVNSLTLRLEPSMEMTNNAGYNYTDFWVEPYSWHREPIQVPPGVTNLSIVASIIGGPQVVYELYLRRDFNPTFFDYDKSQTITPPGGQMDVSIYDSPPLTAGRWIAGIYNPSPSRIRIRFGVALGRNQDADPFQAYTVGIARSLVDDVRTNSSLYVPEQRTIADVMVDVRINHPRIADLVLTLISPSETRILLAENRGGPLATNYGAGFLVTNTLAPFVVWDTPDPITNFITLTQQVGTLKIDYDFQWIPDDLRIYYEGRLLFQSGFISGIGTFQVDFGPGTATNILIVMNETGGNAGTVWSYTPTLMSGRYNYVTFTEDTNLTQMPIKFQSPPFGFVGTNITTVGIVTNLAQYLGPSNYYSYADSPFQKTNEFSFFHLENFEDGALNTPGVTVNNGYVKPPDWATDSVDADDGLLDGLGFNGHSFASRQRQTNFMFTFNAAALGGAPNHVGVVVTGCINWNTVYLEGFGTNGVSLGRQGPFTVPAQSFGTTGGDRFFGLIHSPGIAAFNIMLSGPASTIGSMEWEIDHLQYGRSGLTTTSVMDRLYLLPEDSLGKLVGENSQGMWQLEIWDNLSGNPAPSSVLLDWRLHLSFVNTNAPVNVLTSGVPATINIGGGETVYFSINVPAIATMATNLLSTISGSGLLDLVFNQSGIPATNTPGNVTLLDDVLNGQAILTTNGTPPLLPGSRYYLAVRNNTPGTTNVVEVRVDFNVPQVTSGFVVTGTLDPSTYARYVVTLPADAIIAFFSLDQLSGDLNLYASRDPGLPITVSAEFSSTNGDATNELIVVTNSPVGGTWNLAIFNPSPIPLDYRLTISHLSGVPVAPSPVPASWLGFSSAPRVLANSSAEIEYWAVAGLPYLVESSPDLENWTPVTDFTRTSVKPLTGQPYFFNRLEIPAPDGYPVMQRYFRLRIAE